MNLFSSSPNSLFMHGVFTTVRCPTMVRNSTTIINSGQLLVVLGFRLRLTFALTLKFFTSTASLPQSLSVEHDISAQLFSILSRPNWQKHPSLKNLVPSIAPSHISALFALNLDPQTALAFFNWIGQKHGFKHNVQSYVSMLNILVPNGYLHIAEKMRILMIKSADSSENALFVLEMLRSMNRRGIISNLSSLLGAITCS